MDRRSAIKCTSLMAGMALSSAFVTGFLSGCKPDKTGISYEPSLLSKDQYAFLKNICDVIIPETDTPGAVFLRVPEILENIAAKCYDDRNQNLFINRLEQVATISEGVQAFNNLTIEEQKSKIKSLEEGLDGKYAPLSPSYIELKSSIAAAYLSTEYVGKNLLEYLPVPGEYLPCIPLSETNGKAYTYG